MSIVVTTNAEIQEKAPSANSDKAQATEAAEVEKPSDESQGEEQQENAEDTSKVAAKGDGDASDETEVVEEKPKKKSGIQRLKERHAREIADVRKEIESLKSQGSKSQREEQESITKDPPSDKPRAESYETHEEFVEALTDWKLEQREKLNAEKSRETQAKESFNSKRKSHDERVEKFRASNPDYDRIVEEFIDEHGDVHFSMALQQEILESENGPALIMELLKAPSEFTRLNALGPIAIARAVGRIEAGLGKQEQQVKQETKLTTKAPPPPKPISGSSDKATKKSIYDEGLTQAEFEQLRRQQRQSSWGA